MNVSSPAIGLGLAFLIAALSVLARRMQLALPLALVSAGIVASFLPHVPTVALEPEWVLLLMLPPLLYAAGVGMSWPGFCANLRPILLLAVGCVLFTASLVAALVHYAFGWSWAVGFVLGAIVSPPDAVAPMAILRRQLLPERLLTILEGESLVNDATALVILSFALAAVTTQSFMPMHAVGQFLVIVFGEAAFGWLVGWAMLRVRHAADDPRAEILLAMITPFLAFWPPHVLGGSGVIACVVCGLYVSWNGARLIRPPTRLQGYFIWDLVTWTIEAFLFLLIGLQARQVIHETPVEGLRQGFQAALLVTLVVIVVRFVWVFPATYLPRLSAARRARGPAPDWRSPFLIGWVGLRGVVSLAAALSIPTAVNGQPFPQRASILLITFVVIVCTLVGLGATLPWVIARLDFRRAGAEEAARHRRQEHAARIEGVDATLAALGKLSKPHAPTVVETMRQRNAARREQLLSTADESTVDDPTRESNELQLELLHAERDAVQLAYLGRRLTDDARRRIERELDLDETRISHQLASLRSSRE